ncbi:hypothetical protein FOPG_19426 [Fusarium oxysporum f. sp. conglutinans race 2 54008]|uniref:Uncharacterized protein n=1 Tax=Fusarium oxysporum f. sp. conglutinans race 2 54008 TaxID=1089457 RepID=X0GM14_FUSOX|nr:hypothetical protein FOPG_19426 [Fusarium oxysporum f. sp. conglutinans race 2 54008]
MRAANPDWQSLEPRGLTINYHQSKRYYNGVIICNQWRVPQSASKNVLQLVDGLQKCVHRR